MHDKKARVHNLDCSVVLLHPVSKQVFRFSFFLFFTGFACSCMYAASFYFVFFNCLVWGAFYAMALPGYLDLFPYEKDIYRMTSLLFSG